MTFSTAEKIEELKRELALRRLFYPRMVATCHITADTMTRRIALTKEILQDYEAKDRADAGGEQRDLLTPSGRKASDVLPP